MATIFSLQGPEFLLEMPTNGPVQVQRRVVSVDTLEGMQQRDFGLSAGDLKFAIGTELDDAELAALSGAVESGIPLGLSAGIHTHSVVVARLQSHRQSNRRSSVSLDVAGVKRI